MSTTDDTVPAAETDNAEHTPTPLSEALGGERHERVQEVGVEDDTVPAAAAPAVEAKPEPAAPAAAPTAKVETEEELAARHPAWMRKQLKAERERADRAERQLQQAPRREQPRQPPSEEELNRPVTRAEIQSFHETERLIAKLEMSENIFVDKHGEDSFEEVREWLISKQIAPGNNPMEGWAMAQRNPWAAAYQQYQRERIASEIGDDPAAYRAKLEEQIRSEYEAKMAAHEPVATAPTMQRSAPPAPASTARSAAPRDQVGRFTGPSPLKSVFKHTG